jgi:hypothetical protein
VKVTGFLFILLSMVFAHADQPVVGRKAAQKYFSSDSSGSGGEHVLVLYGGEYMDSQAYAWGPNTIGGAGQANYGAGFTFDQWHNIDVSGRIDVSEFMLQGNRADKASFLPMLSFPRASSRFPLYIGAGAGLGVFFQQLSNKSALSLDYELVVGVRFMEIARSVGLFFEYGFKNQFFFLSDGQFIGTALTGGLIFDF